MARRKKTRISLADAVVKAEHPLSWKGFDYADKVLAGEIVVCRWVQLACERFAKDLQRKRGFSYHFDLERSEDILEFAEKMPHTKGRWAAEDDNNITLEPWQCFLLGNLFGWISKDGFRRFRECYLAIPRKNGKSILAAVVGNYMFAADREYGAEVYSGAKTEKQAWEVFRPARLMALRTDAFREAFDISVNAKSMAIESDGSRFEPVIGNPGDGSSPSCALVDEFHEHKDSRLIDTMETGMASRDQPMLMIITTAGFDLESPCHQKQEETEAVLTGDVKNDKLFGVIYGIDKGDDFADAKVLAKANPNFGVSVSADFLQAKQEAAISSASKQNAFRTKHLNEWVDAKEAYFNSTAWARNKAELTLEDFEGQPCAIGVDMAQKCDFAAKVLVFSHQIDGFPHYFVFPTLYLPEERVFEDKTGKYKRWHQHGHIVATEGNEIDFLRVESDILADTKRFDVQAVNYDPAYATQLSQNLRAKQVPMVEYQQSPAKMGPPMDEMATAITSGRISHPDNRCFNWMIGNVINYRPKAKLPAPGKQTKAKKIDGCVAAMMAIAQLMDKTEEFDAAGAIG